MDLTFQAFDNELASLPGRYAAPKGEILLARNKDGIVMGCVALRPGGSGRWCEMKRLFISPAGRGLGIGRRLVNAILDIATSLGYLEIRLDTLPSMTEALALYKSLGFLGIEPYYHTPLPDTIFLARNLQR